MGKRHKAKPIRFDHFRLFTFGSAEELTRAFGSMERARDVWFSMKDEFLERWDLWGMPDAWWHFEPDVPEDIRRGPSAIITEGDALEWARIEAARRRYLVRLGIDPTPPRGDKPFAPD